MNSFLNDYIHIKKSVFWVLLALPLLLFMILCNIYVNKSDYPNALTQKEYVHTAITKDVNLVFYKRSCPYCKIGKQAVISKAKQSAMTTYFIDSETSEGRQLAIKYGVKYAPSIVVIRTDKAKVYRYAGDKNSQKVVYQDVIDRMFDD